VPSVGSLFSGIGGLDLGLEQAGWSIQWQVENDPYCQQVLARHWPSVQRYGDIRKIITLAPVDLVAGGFPCQPISVAGRRQGQRDERWLWPEFAKVISLLRPSYILVENVPNLRRLGLDVILGSLAELGYDAEWGCISACAFGAPHSRLRLFLVAYTASNGREQRRPVAATDIRIFGGGSYPRRDEWRIESELGRVVDGLPYRVDRLRGLGNAVPPPVGKWLGERLLQHHTTERE